MDAVWDVLADKERASGLTPLHAAAMSGSVACIKLLLDDGASTAALSHEGRSGFLLVVTIFHIIPLKLLTLQAPTVLLTMHLSYFCISIWRPESL